MSLPAHPRSQGDPRVEAELRRRLRARGRLTFAEFMEVALYLPGAGYYQAHAAIGRRGDFITSPETHPVFGALLARLIAVMWRALEAPTTFRVIEYGAGTGSLCRQILEAAPRTDPRLGGALSYSIVEPSEHLRRIQQSALSDLPAVEWVSGQVAERPGCGCVLANEVVDAFPFHRLRMHRGDLREIYVGLAADRYLELLGPLSRLDLRTYLRDAAVDPPEGSAIEINLAAAPWLREAAARLREGYLVTIDFGGSAAELYSGATPRGGLKCFYRHGWTDDPFDRPGLQDIAAPVDLSNLARAGDSLGLQTVLLTSQSQLLHQLGLPQFVERLEARNLRVDEREKNRRAMLAIADPAGLGAYRVLIQAKNAPELALDLLREYPSAWVPLLPAEPTFWSP